MLCCVLKGVLVMVGSVGITVEVQFVDWEKLNGIISTTESVTRARKHTGATFWAATLLLLGESHPEKFMGFSGSTSASDDTLSFLE